MSDLRFVRDLGAEFERLERAGAPSGRRRRRGLGAKLPGRIAMAIALAVPLAIAVLAIALLSVSRGSGRHPATSARQRADSLAAAATAVSRRERPRSSPPIRPERRDDPRRSARPGVPWQLRVKPAWRCPARSRTAGSCSGPIITDCAARSQCVPFYVRRRDRDVGEQVARGPRGLGAAAGRRGLGGRYRSWRGARSTSAPVPAPGAPARRA